MITLNTKDKINKSKMRVGRGIGSGKGKTSGRGVKGQKSRSGVAIKAFEGGQMPLYRRLPKRGFNPISRTNIAIMNLEKIQSFINEKTINPSDTINMELLKKLKLINKNSQKLKILGTGEIKDKVNIEADLASKSAIEKLEKISGSIQLKNNNLNECSSSSNDLRNRILFTIFILAVYRFGTFVPLPGIDPEQLKDYDGW